MAGPCIQHTSLTLTPHISRVDSAHHWSNVILTVLACYTLATYVCYIQAKRLIAYAFLLLEAGMTSESSSFGCLGPLDERLPACSTDTESTTRPYHRFIQSATDRANQTLRARHRMGPAMRQLFIGRPRKYVFVTFTITRPHS